MRKLNHLMLLTNIPRKWLLLLASFYLFFISPSIASNIEKQKIQSLYIPLADHYAAIVAYEKYRNEMIYADFQIKQMESWDLLRAYFQSESVDMAYVMSPLAMDMFKEKSDFRWIGLMHRDGNALAINALLNQYVNVEKDRKNRKPDNKVALALKRVYADRHKATHIAMPHLLSTHSVVLYRYLKENNVQLGLSPNNASEALAISIAPPKAPAFIKAQSNRATPAAFEQSLPWADVVETGGFGHVAWYSKDVMKWPKGHVECIAIAKDSTIKNKFNATQEVMNYIKKAGQDIEEARDMGGESLMMIVDIIQRHIPAHTKEAIIASLSPDLKVINYEYLNIDKKGLKQIMDLGVESGILSAPIDIDAFADARFDSPPEAIVHINKR